MHTEVDVPNPNRVLVPGVYAEATLTLDRKDRVVGGAAEAVNIDGDREPSGWSIRRTKSKQRKITTGIETPDDVEVVSGLQEGELVAVGDRSSLKAGETVRPKVVELIQGQSQQE